MSEAENKDARPIIKRWWHESIGERIEGRPSGTALALAARLRRAGPVETLAERAVFDLSQALGTRDPVRLYRIAKMMAYVRGDVPERLARRLGAGERPMSGLRFQRLMRSEGDDLVTGLIRALPMVKYTCNVAALGGDLFYWSDCVRTAWVFDYHGAAQPEAQKESSE